MKKDSFELFETEKAKFTVEVLEAENCKNLYFIINSYGFKGHGPLYLLENEIKKYIEKLKEMSKTLIGECCIDDTESNSFIKIYFKTRELFVKGSISDYYAHTLTFEFKVDQTIIIPLAKTLELLL